MTTLLLEPMATIYGLVGDEGEIRYVGRTAKRRLEDRMHAHRSAARDEDGVSYNRPVYVWFRSQQSVSIVEIKRVPASDAVREERETIQSMAADGFNLLNLAANGWSPSAEHRAAVTAWNNKRFLDPAARERVGRISRERVFSDEERKRMSERATGRTHTPEAREKMSAARKGVPKSPETRARMKEAQRRRSEAGDFGPLSDETKKKISQTLKGRPKSEEWKQKMRDSHARRRAEREVMGG